MHYAVILNPTAGHGAAGRRQGRLVEALQARGLAFHIQRTEAPGHAVTLARQAAVAGHAVVAVGGDGTVHEVGRGVIESGRPVPLGIVPIGTGNDFVKMIGVPVTIEAAARVLAEGVSRRVDYGRVQWWEDDRARVSPFVNIAGAGLDAAVAAAAARYKRLPGAMAYAAAVLRTLPGWKAPDVDVSARLADGRDADVFQGPLLLATTGNGASAGGGFYLTPEASVTDGMLDLCVIRDLPLIRVPHRFLRVLQGRHGDLDEVTIIRGTKIRIHSKTPLTLHADGETLTLRALRVEMEVVPAGLCVIVPEGATEPPERPRGRVRALGAGRRTT